jgi:hypothetical protein
MKTAIYIEDGLLQVVITPESEFEKKALSTFQNKPIDGQIFTGSFYDCRGGWVRQSAYYPRTSFQDGDMSLILRIGEPKPAEPAVSSGDAPIALYSEPGDPVQKLDEMIAAGEPRSDVE